MKVFPPFRLDAADQSLWRDDQRVPLTPKAFAVLQYLVDRAGRLVAQNELLEALWPDTFVQPEVLKSQILDVRAALGDRPKDPLFIETIPRRGYRFIAPVRDAGTPAPARAERSFSNVVGRGTALTELRDCLVRASAGERQIVFVTGEQGMGKTTLVEAFLEQASGEGVELARGQCLEGYGVVKEPYYPVLEALSQLSRGINCARFAQVLETHAPTWLIQLPALVKPEHRNTLQRELLGATRERMIREICEALEALTAERTLVLFFEDLHWTDHSTVDLLAAIAYRRSPAKLLVIGTYRPVDLVLAQHPMKQASHSLKAHRLAKEIALVPLVEREVADYLSHQAGSEGSDDLQHLARWIREQTGGNPLFMVNVIEHLMELGHIRLNETAWTVTAPLDQIEFSVPETLRQMIELQIERLSPREQLTLDAASVHGNLFSAVQTAAALEVDVEHVEETCQKLAQQHHIVRTAPLERLPDGTFSERYEFVHAAFRNVFYQRLAPARRAKLHRRFAETIEALYGSQLTDVAVELAGHFEECGDWSKAVEYLHLAVQNAWRRFAYRAGISTLEHALEVAEKLPLNERKAWELRFRERLSVLEYALYEPSRVLPALETLTARASEYGVADVEARALMMQIVLRGSESSARCLPLMDRLRSLTSEHKGPMAICTFGWDARLAKEHQVYLDEVRRSGDRQATAMQQMDHGYVDWVSSKYANCIENAQASLPVLLETGQMIRYLMGRDLLAVNHILLGQLGTGLDILDETIENAHKNAAPHRLAQPLLFKAWTHLMLMDYQGVLEMCVIALPSLTDPIILDRRYIGLRLKAAAELGLGRYNSAIERLTELRATLEERPVMLSWYWGIPLQMDLTEAYLALHDLAQARLEANRALERTLATEERTLQALAWEASARVALRAGEDARLRTDLKNALDLLEGFDIPLAAWRVHGTAARVYAMDGDGELEHKHRSLGRNIVISLAKSLDRRPALQQVFLSTPVVSELLGDEHEFRTAPMGL